MNAYFINTIPGNVVRAIGNVIFNSLWQGLILAAAGGVIMLITRNASSARRYKLLVAALAIFAAASVLTVIHYILSARTAFSTGREEMPGIYPVVIPASYTQHTVLEDTLIAFFNTHCNTIVLLWFLIVCMRSIQMMTGLYALHRLRHHLLTPVNAAWQIKVKTLAVKLGIRQVIGVAESGIAKVPMVIGNLKPLILIPAGLITMLAPEEIEAVLIHELAHIRRKDYLVNMLQSLMEIIFFFNPAVLWISTMIRTERENCCDDIVVTQTSSRADYIRALVSCQEFQLSTPNYAMALVGRKDHLLSRVKRIISNSNQSMNIKEKSIFASCLIAAGLFITLLSHSHNPHKVTTTTTVITTINTKFEVQDSLVLRNSRSTQEYVAQNEVCTKPVSIQITRPSDTYSIPNFPIAPVQSAIDLLPLEPIAPAGPSAKPEMPEYDRKEAELNKMQQKSMQAEADRQDRMQKQADELRKTRESIRKLAAPRLDSLQHSYELDQLTTELLNTGIIKEKQGRLSFKLSTLEFIVNGVKQPDNVFKQFRQKYVKAKGPDEWAWYYNYESSLETVTVI